MQLLAVINKLWLPSGTIHLCIGSIHCLCMAWHGSACWEYVAAFKCSHRQCISIGLTCFGNLKQALSVIIMCGQLCSGLEPFGGRCALYLLSKNSAHSTSCPFSMHCMTVQI